MQIEQTMFQLLPGHCWHSLLLPTMLLCQREQTKRCRVTLTVNVNGPLDLRVVSVNRKDRRVRPRIVSINLRELRLTSGPGQ